MTVDVYDWDASSSDDFLGHTSVKLSEIIDQECVTSHKSVDRWIALSNVSKGEIHLKCDWSPAKPMTQGDPANLKRAVLSVFVDR